MESIQLRPPRSGTRSSLLCWIGSKDAQQIDGLQETIYSLELGKRRASLDLLKA